MHALNQVLWKTIRKCTAGKSQTNKSSIAMHPLRRTIWGNIWKLTVEKKSNKCIQCDYACSEPSALKDHLKTHSGKSQTNASASSETMHPLVQTIWGNIWKLTAEKNQTNVTNVIMHALNQLLWRTIWKRTVGKSQTNATSVTMHPPRQALWGHIGKAKQMQPMW